MYVKYIHIYIYMYKIAIVKSSKIGREIDSSK